MLPDIDMFFFKLLTFSGFFKKFSLAKNLGGFMSKFAVVPFAFMACLFEQADGCRLNREVYGLPFNDIDIENYPRLQSEYSHYVQDLNSKFQNKIREIGCMCPVLPNDSVGCGVTSLLYHFAQENNLDQEIFYNLTNYMNLLNWDNQVKYLNRIDLGEGSREPRNFRIGINTLKRNFKATGTSLDQKCFLLSKMNRWLVWLEDACENDWWRINEFQCLYIKTEFEYSVMFLETLLLLNRENCSGIEDR